MGLQGTFVIQTRALGFVTPPLLFLLLRWMVQVSLGDSEYKWLLIQTTGAIRAPPDHPREPVTGRRCRVPGILGKVYIGQYYRSHTVVRLAATETSSDL
jgi:hypothetical protein